MCVLVFKRLWEHTHISLLDTSSSRVLLQSDRFPTEHVVSEVSIHRPIFLKAD